MPTRVSLALGGTGSNNIGKIRVHSTLNRLTVGSNATPQANLHVFGDTLITGDLTVLGSGGGVVGNSAIFWTVVDEEYTANDGESISANTAVSGFDIELPASKSSGDYWNFNDHRSTWGTNNLNIVGNGHFFEDGSANLLCNFSTRFSIMFNGANLTVRT